MCVIEPEFTSWARRGSLERYPMLPEAVIYSSDSELCLLPETRVREVLTK